MYLYIMTVVGASPFGLFLLKNKIITDAQLLEAMKIQKKERKSLGHILLKLGYITEDKLTKALSTHHQAPVIHLKDIQLDHSLLKLIPYEVVVKHQVIPLAKNGDALKVAMADPSNSIALEDIKFLTGMNVIVHIAPETEILETIERNYQKRETPQVTKAKTQETDVLEDEAFNKVIDSALDQLDVDERKEEEDVIKQIDAPIIRLVNNIFLNAINSRASDIHIEPSEVDLSVRYRVDGILTTAIKLPLKIKNALISRVKIMAHLDISERRLPQDGRIKLKIGEKRKIDLRVSTLPTIFGEKIVIRILDKSSLQLDLTKLGLEEKSLKDFLTAIQRPYGMILVTGPTGSGKTTTLYSILSRLNKPEVNIMTAEDPVEYNFVGINQVQIKEEIGLTFASALRAFLRQDPDIIMVGEIRDFETAEIATKAALTGHLVLSTLHTNDAPTTITRLVNMGIEPFLVASSVILVAAQRLVRKICSYCKVEQQVPENTLINIGFTPEDAKKITCYIGKGCQYCNNTGYKGRIALYEVMPMKEEIKELVLQGTNALEIKKEAIRLGMITLRQSGIEKIKQGIVSYEEVLKATFED
ncbi:MAG: type IV-A pilus assembly ATPase PilB [Thermodesulfovibrionales bacterium]|nr:type IV-A pilus assembly ATPase PilB [Thermodesulfovibrionales bacterium]